MGLAISKLPGTALNMYELSIMRKFVPYVCFQGLMHLPGRPVAAFDPEGLIFGAGINSEHIKLYDLRSFDKVCVAINTVIWQAEHIMTDSGRVRSPRSN